jgi:hypothetical protein
LKLRTILALAYSVLWLGFLLLLAVSWPAKAQAGYCAKWSHGIRCSSNYTIDFGPSCRRVRRCLHWVHSDPYRRYDPHHSEVERRHYRSTEIRHYRDDRDEDGPRCRDVRRTVGQQHLTLEGAKREANDAWAALVRFHLGEKFIDLTNARHVTYSCSRSSIKDASVTTLGQTFTRCEIEAQPCRPRRETLDEAR